MKAKYVRYHYNVKCWYHDEVWMATYQTFKECVDFLKTLEKEETPDKVEIRECVITL